MLDDYLAEGLTLLCVPERNFKSGPGHANGLRRDTDATALKIGKCDSVTLTFCTKSVFGRDTELVEPDFACVRRMLSHFALDPGHTIAGLLCLNDETADATFSQPEIGRGKHQSDIGILA